MQHPTDRTAQTTALVIPIMEHWLEREIAQWVHHEGLIPGPITPWADALPWNHVSPPLLFLECMFGCSSKMFNVCQYVMSPPWRNDLTTHRVIRRARPDNSALWAVAEWLREREMFYLTTHSTHFIYGYMASNIWLRTILIVRKETRCRHIGYSYRLTARVLLYASSHRQDNTYHSLCYTSRGALAGTRNSSMGPPHEGSTELFLVPASAPRLV